MSANDEGKQVGGTHYKELEKQGEQHWDKCWRLYREAWFVCNITKYVERHKKREGIKDLQKARHYCEKLIEKEEGDGNLRTGWKRLQLPPEERRLLVNLFTEERYQEYITNKVENYRRREGTVELIDTLRALDLLIAKEYPNESV